MSMPARAVAAATVAYAVIFTLLGMDRYATYHSGADLGLFMQTIASAGDGFRNTFEGANHFAFHFSPILYLCAPFVWLAHSAYALIGLQAIATALIAPALYLIARKRTSERNAAVLACIALLYPPLQGVTFTDFHENAFAPAAVAWLLWAIDSRRFAWAAVLLAAVLSIKEDQAVAMAFLGVAGAVWFGRRGERAGFAFSLAATVASVAVLVVYFGVVQPMAAARGAWMPSHFYAWAGNSGAAPAGAQFGARMTYLLEAFVPLAFVPFRSRALLLSIPGFAEVLASHEPLTYTMGQHYAAVWVPYVLVAFALAGARLLDGGAGSRRWIWGSAILCAVTLAFFSPLHLGHFLRARNAADGATDAMLLRVPPNASIGTYDEIYAHLGFYPNAAVGVKERPEYVIEDSAYRSARWNGFWLPQLRTAIDKGTYTLLAQDRGVLLYSRTGSP